MQVHVARTLSFINYLGLSHQVNSCALGLRPRDSVSPESSSVRVWHTTSPALGIRAPLGFQPRSLVSCFSISISLSGVLRLLFPLTSPEHISWKKSFLLPTIGKGSDDRMSGPRSSSGNITRQENILPPLKFAASVCPIPPSG